MADLSGWEKAAAIGSVFGGVGGIAAAFSAWFARDAATASRDAARDTRLALALATKPEVSLFPVIDFEDRGGGFPAPSDLRLLSFGATATVKGLYPAADVELVVFRGDGIKVIATQALVAPGSALSTPLVKTVPPDNTEPRPDRMLLEYSDENRTCRWRVERDSWNPMTASPTEIRIA